MLPDSTRMLRGIDSVVAFHIEPIVSEIIYAIQLSYMQIERHELYCF